MTIDKEVEHHLKYLGQICIQKNQALEERLELVEYWTNQLAILLIGPGSGMNQKDVSKH